MTDDGAITNRILLEHIQSSKLEVLQKLNDSTNELTGRIDKLENRVGRLENRVGSLEVRVERNFEEARLHRQALREDLDATIRTQFKHGKQLAVLTGGSVTDN